MKESRVFSRLMDEYGNLEQEEAEAEGKKRKDDDAFANKSDGLDDKKANAALMQAEERNTGSVSWSTYGKYLKFAGSLLWAPFILGLLAASQGAQGKWNTSLLRDRPWIQYDQFMIVGNNLFLGFWTARSIDGFRHGDYMAVYAALGRVKSDVQIEAVNLIFP